MCLNSVVDLGNKFFGDWGQQEFGESIKQQNKHIDKSPNCLGIALGH